MRIRYLGHAGFQVVIDEVKILVDPFITRNPSTKLRLDEIDKSDIVAVTHNHFDHFGDSIELAKRDSACFVGIYDTVEIAESNGVENTEAMNIGGTCVVRGIKVSCVPAIHTGNPCGLVFSGHEGTIYHAGDTGLFSDMRLIGELFKPDVAMLPIGGKFTMGSQEAAIAAELVRPKAVIPMHYNTFESIRQDPTLFAELLRSRRTDIKVIIMREGETIELGVE
ncbi:MAG: metal-dependent hydrolase [Candidatus Verstraetearchaeota archaeon]|nr:metal-dependent hydrolase [Candidatus Verstraetearchaeota archaeon]